jgi:hypothetical protein
MYVNLWTGGPRRSSDRLANTELLYACVRRVVAYFQYPPTLTQEAR